MCRLKIVINATPSVAIGALYMLCGLSIAFRSTQAFPTSDVCVALAEQTDEVGKANETEPNRAGVRKQKGFAHAIPFCF